MPETNRLLHMIRRIAIGAILGAVLGFAPIRPAKAEAPQSPAAKVQANKPACENCAKTCGKKDTQLKNAVQHRAKTAKPADISPAEDTRPGGLAWPGF